MMSLFESNHCWAISAPDSWTWRLFTRYPGSSPERSWSGRWIRCTSQERSGVRTVARCTNHPQGKHTGIARRSTFDMPIRTILWRFPKREWKLLLVLPHFGAPKLARVLPLFKWWEHGAPKASRTIRLLIYSQLQTSGAIILGKATLSVGHPWIWGI